MTRPALASLAIALLSLSACNSQESANGAAPAGGAIAGKAAPAGTTWSQQVVATPEGGFRMGNPDAPIKIVEFGSYTCSHCADFSQTSHEPLERDYVNSGKVSFEYRNFIRDPLDMAVALVARCSGPETFFPLSAQFFANQPAMFQVVQTAGDSAYQAAMSAPPQQRFVQLAQMAGLIDYAKARGVPEDKARQCLADTKTVETLSKSVEQSIKDFDIQGTPTLLMNGTKLDNVATWPLLQERLKAAGA